MLRSRENGLYVGDPIFLALNHKAMHVLIDIGIYIFSFEGIIGV